MIKVSIEQREAILKDLKSLEESLQRKAVNAGLTRATKPIRDLMAETAPEKTGALSRSIGQTLVSKSATHRLGMGEQTVKIVGPKRDKMTGIWQGKKGRLQEFGTKKMEANPFMSRALDSVSGATVENLFYQGLSNYIEKKTK